MKFSIEPLKYIGKYLNIWNKYRQILRQYLLSVDMRMTYLADISKIKNINRNSKHGVDHGHDLAVFRTWDSIAIPSIHKIS